MPYLYPFHRIVMIGSLYSDQFNTTLSVVPANATNSAIAVTTALVNEIGTRVAAWWPTLISGSAGGGISIIAAAKLTSVKVNRIGTNGRYVDADTKEWLAPAPVAGGWASNVAPQLSLAVTLRGQADRAQAGKGRMYFPPSQTMTLQSDGRVGVSDAVAHARGVQTLLKSIEAGYALHTVASVAAITSATRTGAVQSVYKLSTGRVVDTMRSRRNKQLEDPQEILYG